MPYGKALQLESPCQCQPGAAPCSQCHLAWLRAHRGKEIFIAYQAMTGGDQISDLLADLMHLADHAPEVNFEGSLNTGRGFHRREAHHRRTEDEDG
ncbi:MAG: hypothetical protein ACLFSI_08160 [Halorhodospira sp.]